MTNEGSLKRVTFNPGVFGGKPIVRGMRISVELVLIAPRVQHHSPELRAVDRRLLGPAARVSRRPDGAGKRERKPAPVPPMASGPCSLLARWREQPLVGRPEVDPGRLHSGAGVSVEHQQ